MTEIHTFHFKDKIKKVEKITFLFFMILSLYGCYKNGLIYVPLGKMTVYKSLSLLLYPLISIIEMIFISLIFKKKINNQKILMAFLMGLLVPSTLSKLSFFIYSMFYIIFYFCFLEKYQSLSKIALYKVGLMFLSKILIVDLLNEVEEFSPYVYGSIDYFFGKSVGPFGLTNLFLLLIFYIFLNTYDFYKKDIPIYSIISYTVSFFLLLFLKPTEYALKDLLNCSFFFTTILLLPINELSPVSNSLKVIYGFLFGVLSFIIIHLFHILEGGYLAFLIINFLWNIIIYIKKHPKIRQNK